MDKRDRDNLEFLLNTKGEALRKWYDSVSDDDRNYADELLRQYSEELKVKLTLIIDPDIEDVSEANNILKTFRLGDTD